MRIESLKYLFLFSFLFGIQSIHAQLKDTLIWQITTEEGNEFYGTILEESNYILKLKTKEFGELNIKINEIEKRQQVISSPNSDGVYWPGNKFSTRYFWGSSGYGLKKGEGYYQNIWIFFNQVSYGLTDNLSVGIGSIPFFSFGAGDATPFWITPKVSIPIKKDQLNIGLGVLYLFYPGQQGNLGMAYGNLTFGSRNKNATIGLGYGFSDDKLSKYPTLNMSAMLRTGKRSYLITENYFISLGDQTNLIFLIGGRWAGKGIAIDYGVIRPVAFNLESEIIVLPWLGIHIPFGRMD